VRRSPALVRLLAPLGIAPPAVRTAVSPDGASGLLHPLRLVSGPGYLLTPKAARRLDEAAARIYRTGRAGWDGRFDLILLHGPLAKKDASRLSFLGYGTLGDHAWVAPRAAEEVDAVLLEAGVGYERFSAAHAAGSPGATEVVGKAWDLPTLASSYETFVADHAAGGERGQTPGAATRRRTRPASGSCMPGARSCSATPSCRRRCCRRAGPG